jgi:hypothetical protein
MAQEMKPSAVHMSAKQDGGSPGKGSPLKGDWSWVEPAVWSERMLAALEQGVKGGKWFSLMDKVYSVRNLEAAYRKVAKNKGSPGVDRVTIGAFGEQLEANLGRLHEQGYPHKVAQMWAHVGWRKGVDSRLPLRQEGVASSPTCQRKSWTQILPHVLKNLKQRDPLGIVGETRKRLL